MERGMREIEGTRCREGYLEESSRTNRKFKKIIIKKPIRRRENRTQCLRRRRRTNTKIKKYE